MAKRVVIWGAGGHALVVADAVRSNGEEVFGFIDTVNPIDEGARILGLPIWTSIHDVENWCRDSECEIAIGFGHCAARSRLIRNLDHLGVGIKTVVHARACVSSMATLGRGVYVAPHAVVEAKALIGDGVIVNAGSLICHECCIGQAVSICPGVSIGGKTKVGEMSWLGIGSTLVDKINIGKGCYIGAGAVVVKDVPDRSLAYGVPARVMRQIVSEF